MNWRDNAACRHHDPELWWPITYAESTTWMQIDTAKAICADCPVAGECLSYALRHRERFGIWGGATPGERERLAQGVPVVAPPPTAPTPDAVTLWHELDELRARTRSTWNDLAKEFGVTVTGLGLLRRGRPMRATATERAHAWIAEQTLSLAHAS